MWDWVIKVIDRRGKDALERGQCLWSDKQGVLEGKQCNWSGELSCLGFLSVYKVMICFSEGSVKSSHVCVTAKNTPGTSFWLSYVLPPFEFCGSKKMEFNFKMLNHHSCSVDYITKVQAWDWFALPCMLSSSIWFQPSFSCLLEANYWDW